MEHHEVGTAQPHCPPSTLKSQGEFWGPSPASGTGVQHPPPSEERSLPWLPPSTKSTSEQDAAWRPSSDQQEPTASDLRIGGACGGMFLSHSNCPGEGSFQPPSTSLLADMDNRSSPAKDAGGRVRSDPASWPALEGKRMLTSTVELGCPSSASRPPAALGLSAHDLELPHSCPSLCCKLPIAPQECAEHAS